MQNLELDASQKLSFVFSEKLDEIDKAFTMAPDTNVINTLHKNLKYLQLNKSNLKSRSSLLSDVDLYIFRISEYYKCLQEYELLCKQIIPGKIVKSTVTDIMSIYKMDLSYFPFLKGAYFYSIDYPDSMKFRDDFLWFVLNDVQIPSK